MMKLRDYTTVQKRREAVEEFLELSLPNIGSFSLDQHQAATKNCENMIGVVQVPLGIAGPLSLTSSLQKREVYIPLATTEGALVASVGRGCKAVTQAGGTTVISEKIGITRAPVFSVKNILAGKDLIEFIEKSFSQIKKISDSTSNHLKLLDIKSWMVGRSVYLRMRFDSQDAMGMNMATIAATKISEFIQAKTKAVLIAVSGNMCVDKKPNYLNFSLGRGIKVWAEATISEEIIATVLKTTSNKILEVSQRKLVFGSMLSGSIGSSAHMANILSAIFLATGQDVAHVAECSVGVTSVEKATNGLYISIYLPDLVVGTVGGGTGLQTQQEALSILGIAGGNNGKNSQKLAEIIGGTVLAGELSLLASLSENSLSKAHITLGRGGQR